MQTILVINDNSPEAEHALKFALELAQKMRANILLANTFNINNRNIVKVVSGSSAEPIKGKQSFAFMNEPFNLSSQAGFRPEIEKIDISGMDESEVAELINKKHLYMIVKGMAEALRSENLKRRLNVHSILNKVLCPLLLVPVNWALKYVERLTYIVDLRYCCIQIVRCLAELAKPFKADLFVANLTANGLPPMDEKYAHSFFSEVISSHINYDQLFINNIKEKDLRKVVDVLINVLNNDLLVLANRHFHFEEILGWYISDTLPKNITIPLLIFPY
jgi:hypothetical protein